ncbi:MAG: hypothetical protein KC733_09815, partial [Candidatus Omnitrophica bacterium]|nr:hypothetical protein [Candidatus Omnitrophota bacterium]
MKLTKLKNSVFIRVLVHSFLIFPRRWFGFLRIVIAPVLSGIVFNQYFLENDIFIRGIIQATSLEFFYLIDFLFTLIIFFILLIALTASVIYLDTCDQGEDSGFIKIHKESLKKTKSLCWVFLLYGMHVAVRLLLLIIPGIFAAIHFSLAPFLVIVENRKGKDALMVSKDYVKKNFNRYLDPLFYMMCGIFSYCFVTILFFDITNILIYDKFDLNV